MEVKNMWSLIITTPIFQRKIKLKKYVEDTSERLSSMGVEHTHTDRSITIGRTTYYGKEIDELNELLDESQAILW